MLMEQNSSIEQNKQQNSTKPVQSENSISEKPCRKQGRPRKLEPRMSNQQSVKKILATQKLIIEDLRCIRHQLDNLGGSNYSRGAVEKFAVMDQVDKEVAQRLLELGANGALPKDVAAEVNRRCGYSLKYYDVSRRIVRMNNRLKRDTRRLLFEKRGHKWALTRFAFEVYGTSDLEDPSIEYDNQL